MLAFDLASSPAVCVVIAFIVALSSVCATWYTVVQAQVSQLAYRVKVAEEHLERRVKVAEDQLERRVAVVEGNQAGIKSTVRDIGSQHWRALASVGTALENAHASDLRAGEFDTGSGGDVFYRDKRNRELELAAEHLLVAPLPALRRTRASAPPPMSSNSTGAVSVSFSAVISSCGVR